MNIRNIIIFSLVNYPNLELNWVYEEDVEKWNKLPVIELEKEKHGGKCFFYKKWA